MRAGLIDFIPSILFEHFDNCPAIYVCIYTHPGRFCQIHIDIEDWPFGGYRHILTPPRRYRLTANKKLMELMNIWEVEQLRETYRNWIDAAIMKSNTARQTQLTESIAIGNTVYVEISIGAPADPFPVRAGR